MRNNLIEARTAVNVAVGFLAKKVRPTVKYHKYNELCGDAHVSLSDTIEIYAIDDFEIDTLKGKEKVPGFVVVGINYTPGWFDYRAGVGGPPETDEFEIGRTRSAVEAAKIALNAYFAQMVENSVQGYYEHKAWKEEEAQREQWEKEQGLI